MKIVLRLILRIPYFYYWSYKIYPYNFELWLSFYISSKLAKGLLDKLDILVPKSYYEFIKKYPFTSLMALNTKKQTNSIFYHYEAKKEDTI